MLERYSIDAYMNCVDACYQTLKHKMNGRWRWCLGCRSNPIEHVVNNPGDRKLWDPFQMAKTLWVVHGGDPTPNDLDLFFSSVFCLRKNHGMKITIKKTHRLGEYVWLELFPEHQVQTNPWRLWVIVGVFLGVDCKLALEVQLPFYNVGELNLHMFSI